MKPGRELDALIAEKVMGLPVARNSRGGWSIGDPDYYDDYGMLVLSNPLPGYSTDIAAVWEVVEKVGGTFRLLTDHANPIEWSVYFCTMFKGGLPVEATAVTETAPHAICLAALRAVGYEFK